MTLSLPIESENWLKDAFWPRLAFRTGAARRVRPTLTVMRIRAAIGTAACLVAAFAATAAAADAPTLTSSADAVQFGSGVTLEGSAPGQAGQTVQVFATGCGFVGSPPLRPPHAHRVSPPRD